MNVAETLDTAVANIEMDGWWSGFNRDGTADGLHCASTAIFALERWKQEAPAQEAFIEYLGGRGIGSVWDWNDAPGQTKENVIATMRACAAIWRAKHEESVASVESSTQEVVNA